MNNSVKTTEAFKRISALFDDGAFTELDPYARSAEGSVEVVAGFGTINGAPCYAFSQDVSVNGGAISVAQCSKIKKIYDLATKTGYPVVAIYDSNGVKLTEGFEALSAYGEIVKTSTSVSGVVPQIAIVAGACLGATALMANMADVVIAVKDADFYITAPSDLTVEDSSKAGVVDIVVDSFEEAVAKASTLTALLPSNNLSPLPIVESVAATAPIEVGVKATMYSLVDNALDVVELKADYAGNVVTALASIAGSTVGIVGFNGDAICPSCAYKAEAMIKLCDAYNIPVITIVDAAGLNKDAGANMLISATKLASTYATATCPKISLITGQAIGTAYIILAGKGANADITFAIDDAVASPLDVEAGVAFMFNDRLAAGEDRAALEAEYKETIGSVYTAAACGAIDDVIASEEARAKIISALDMLYSKRESTIARKHSVK